MKEKPKIIIEVTCSKCGNVQNLTIPYGAIRLAMLQALKQKRKKVAKEREKN